MKDENDPSISPKYRKKRKKQDEGYIGASPRPQAGSYVELLGTGNTAAGATTITIPPSASTVTFNNIDATGWVATTTATTAVDFPITTSTVTNVVFSS